MKAIPALMNGTFSPYCSVRRVFNMGFFRVELGYRGSGPIRPMKFCPVAFRGKHPTANFAGYHLPTCMPPSTRNTSPVMWRASVR